MIKLKRFRHTPRTDCNRTDAASHVEGELMGSERAISNFKSCCKALVDSVSPGRPLTKGQELAVLSYLLVVKSALLVSHSHEGNS